jgi:hypothetical protein
METALSSAPGGYTGPFTTIAGSPVINVGAGIAGNNTITLPSGSSLALTTPDIPALPTSFALGFGLIMASAPSAASTILEVAIGANNCTLVLDATGTLTWNVGSAFSVASAAATYQFNGIRQFVEVYVGGIGSSQTAKVQYEGTVAGTGTGTTYSGSNFSNFLWLADANVASSPTIDSLYMLDLTGSARNNMLGKRVVVLQISASSGQYSQFTPQGAATNWQALASIPAAGDSIYTADDNPGDQVAVGLSSPGGLSSVDFVMQRASARQEVASGGRTIALGIGNGTTIIYGATQNLPVNYTGLNQVWDKDPTTGVDWVLGNLGSRQAAIQTVS